MCRRKILYKVTGIYKHTHHLWQNVRQRCSHNVQSVNVKGACELMPATVNVKMPQILSGLSWLQRTWGLNMLLIKSCCKGTLTLQIIIGIRRKILEMNLISCIINIWVYVCLTSVWRHLKCCYYSFSVFKSYSNHHALFFMLRGTGVRRQSDDVLVNTKEPFGLGKSHSPDEVKAFQHHAWSNSCLVTENKEILMYSLMNCGGNPAYGEGAELYPCVGWEVLTKTGFAGRSSHIWCKGKILKSLLITEW